MENFIDNLIVDFSRIKQEKPLIHHITNYVVMNETANLTLCTGALPVMAHAKEEVSEMVRMAGALVINVGTLSPAWIEAMIIAGKDANERGIPVILDPVGVGATSYRTESTHKILEEVKISIIRGNSAEISMLSGYESEIKGVESIGTNGNITQFSSELANSKNCVVVVTGKEDIVSDGSMIARINNGSASLSTITGSGCMSTTMVAIYNAVQNDPLLAAVEGLIVFGVAGELADMNSAGPGSFHVNIYDSIANLTGEQIKERAKYSIE